MESSAIRTTPQSVSFDSLKARVVTKAFGLRIGAFGVDYTSKSVEVDPDQTTSSQASVDPESNPNAGAAWTSRQDTRAQAFQTEMDREILRQQVWDVSYSQTDQPQGAQAASQDGASTNTSASTDGASPAKRLGLNAYARARDLLRSDALRLASTRLAVA